MVCHLVHYVFFQDDCLKHFLYTVHMSFQEVIMRVTELSCLDTRKSTLLLPICLPERNALSHDVHKLVISGCIAFDTFTVLCI